MITANKTIHSTKSLCAALGEPRSSYYRSQKQVMIPECFGSIEDARAFCRDFFSWYNTEHRHSGIAMLTPDSVHYNQYEKVLNARSIILFNAYMDHPERFVKGVPSVELVPKEVWINKPILKEMVETGVS